MQKKGSKNGRPSTQTLFIDYNPEGKYSLEVWHKVFIEEADITEYRAAMVLTGSWEDWCVIKRCWPHFRKVILAGWLEELEVKLRSDAIKQMVGQSKEKNGTNAAKWIAEGKYRQRGPGKPSNAEVEREARIAAGVESEVDADIARMENLMEQLNG